MEGELEQRCQKANRTLHDLRAQLELMERKRDDPELQSTVLSQLNSLLREGSDLESLLENPLSMMSGRRDYWKLYAINNIIPLVFSLIS